MDQLTKNSGGTKTSGTISHVGMQRPQTASIMTAFKENQSIMSNTESIQIPMIDGGNPDLLRKEISMLKKELKRVNDIMGERDREIEKVKKENYNLINRYRNK